MGYVLRSGLDASVPTASHSPSPPYSCSLSSSTTRRRSKTRYRFAIARIEEGDSRGSVEEVYPGEQATETAAQLLQDPKAVEKAMATLLPNA